MLQSWHCGLFGDGPGIAIFISSANDQRHVGIIHGSDESEPRLLELGWHLRLSNAPPRPGLVLVPRLSGRVLRQIAAYCRSIWSCNARGNIPYGFGLSLGALNEIGFYDAGPLGPGLTCATFVMAIFEAQGIDLIDRRGWPYDRVDDLVWRDNIISLLERLPTPPVAAHIQSLRDQKPFRRYRPEEVVASVALLSNANFDVIEPISLDLVSEMKV